MAVSKLERERVWDCRLIVLLLLKLACFWVSSCLCISTLFVKRSTSFFVEIRFCHVLLRSYGPVCFSFFIDFFQLPLSLCVFPWLFLLLLFLQLRRQLDSCGTMRVVGKQTRASEHPPDSAEGVVSPEPEFPLEASPQKEKLEIFNFRKLNFTTGVLQKKMIKSRRTDIFCTYPPSLSEARIEGYWEGHISARSPYFCFFLVEKF